MRVQKRRISTCRFLFSHCAWRRFFKTRTVEKWHFVTFHAQFNTFRVQLTQNRRLTLLRAVLLREFKYKLFCAFGHILSPQFSALALPVAKIVVLFIQKLTKFVGFVVVLKVAVNCSYNNSVTKKEATCCGFGEKHLLLRQRVVCLVWQDEEEESSVVCLN